MPAAALALALAAAVVHAAWNLLLSGEEDTHSATAVAAVTGVLVFAPVAALTWHLEGSAVPFMLASAALESIYLALLATGYGRAAMGFVYPVSRGSAPVVVLLVSVVFLGAAISALAALGLLLVAGGIVLVRGIRGGVHLPDLALALTIGVCIAGYTLVDKRGITHGSPLSYLEVVFGLVAFAYLAGAWRARGPAALRAAVRPRPLLAGVGYFSGYLLTLAALRLASAPSVAAVRESSVVIAAVWLMAGGREPVSGERLAGAAAVVGGIALISLG
jgi:drug/metabolite transporter (DMT)-like permease